MKKWISIITSLMVIVMMCTACGSGDKQEVSVYTEPVKSFEDALDIRWAYYLTKDLAYNEDMGGGCGFRTAGSDYEHKCADYLVGVMKDIGLEDVKKEGIPVDKWQFDDASLKIKNTDISITPASYAQNGTDKDGITAEIVNVKEGFAENYKNVDVKGKIVLAGINQRDEAWIDGYIHEANLHGAAALVTYDVGGYATASDEIRNMQDVCCDDCLPTVSISNSEAQNIIKAIKNGDKKCTLKVDNEVVEGGGTSYNVVGKIKGKSSDQQIVLSGHYDKYFYGFQDDSAAIGAILGIAKAMKDSGYKPENDIVVVCHGAEEWGSINSQYDWTTGAWEMINNKHPEWAGKTLAMFNFELPAYYVKNPDKEKTDAGFVCTVPEFKSYASDVLSSNLSEVFDTGVYEGGILPDAKDVSTMEDGMSYRFAGVPYFLNGVYFEGGFTEERYHTELDNRNTFNEDVMKQNMGIFGALAIVTDQSPALELNMSDMSKWLGDTYSDDWAAKAGADTETFKAQNDKYGKLTTALYDKAVGINEEYEKAYKDGDKDKMKELRKEGKELNKLTLSTFATAQDDFLGVVSSWEIYPRHEGDIQTLDLLQNITTQIKADKLYTDDEDGAADLAWQLNGATEYGYYIFSKEGAKKTADSYFIKDKTFWGTDKTVPFVDTAEGTRSLVLDEDMKAALPVYQKEYKAFLPVLKKDINREIKGLKIINTELEKGGIQAEK